jgi:hypothetical protein
MARRRYATAPPLPGWGPITAPQAYPRARLAGLVRWAWPITAIGGFLALVGYAMGHDDPTRSGLSDPGLLTVALAVVVVLVLTVRRAAGPRALLRTLTEYTVVGLLVLSPAGLDAGPAAKPEPRARARPPAAAPAREQAPDQAREKDRPLLIQAVEAPGNVIDWISDLWRRADQQAAPPPRR